MIAGQPLTLPVLQTNLAVFPETGKLVWARRKKKVVVGTEAGFIKKGDRRNGGGYRMVCINQRHYRAHHLVWLWYHGRWPGGEIDHINGDRDDNRIENLREVTVSQNRTNKTIQTNNRSGYKWVYRCTQTGRWKAEIAAPKSMGIGRKRLHQSFHETAEEAYQAACDAARRIHGVFFNDGR